MSDCTVKTDLNLFGVYINGFLRLRLLEVVHKVSVNLSLCISLIQVVWRGQENSSTHSIISTRWGRYAQGTDSSEQIE